MKENNISIVPIGYVIEEELSGDKALQIKEEYREGLLEIDKFSHILVLWYSNQLSDFDIMNNLLVKPPYAEEESVGIYATRAPYHPNLLCQTICEIEDVDYDNGIIHISGMEAFIDTPIIDIKVYIPVCDKVKDVKLPEWLPEDWKLWWEPYTE